ncbi:MAG: 50S ribosomal protein L20 [Candidatus Omnitrophota bacterium]|nr:MAG: 50S ribosomal protein L20 [Candidatus Omnitrophota bacterium]
MVRVKYAPARRRKKKRLFKKVKGARGGRSKLLRTAKETLRRSLAYSYRDRKVKKRDMRSLWIARINARLKEKGLSYNKFIAGLKKAKVNLNRKVLADLAVNDKAAFDYVVETVMKG